MRCIEEAAVENKFGSLGFSVLVAEEWRRRALVLDSKVAARQHRVGMRHEVGRGGLDDFAERLNRWLPSGCGRLLWIDDWNDLYPNIQAVFSAARAGLGEKRSVSEAPGHYFDAHPYDNADQTEISPDHLKEIGLIVGFVVLIMIAEWDGWLIAEHSADRVEFWEGNVFLHSSDARKIESAKALMAEFDVSPVLR